MSRRTFTVTALWDEEARVYYSDSDIIGLHIEAATLAEFESEMREHAPDLIVANHLSKPELARNKIGDLIPMILLKTPESSVAERH
jgi:adenylate kinase